MLLKILHYLGIIKNLVWIRYEGETKLCKVEDDLFKKDTKIARFGFIKSFILSGDGVALDLKHLSVTPGKEDWLNWHGEWKPYERKTIWDVIIDEKG